MATDYFKSHCISAHISHVLVVIAAILADGWFDSLKNYGFTISYFIAMATIKLLLGIFLFTVSGSIGMLKRNLLGAGLTIPVAISSMESVHRNRLVALAMAEVGVREATGENDGKRVEEYLAVAGLKKGLPWCAAFVSWVYAKEGFKKPRTGWSPDLFPASRLARSALPGDVLGIYFQEYKRIAHVGLVEKVEGDWCFSYEGNTNNNGSRNGDGVYYRRRHVKTIYRISNWIKEGGTSK